MYSSTKTRLLIQKKLSKFKAKEVTVFISLTLVTAKLDLGEEKMKENQQFKEQDFARNTKQKKKNFNN